MEVENALLDSQNRHYSCSAEVVPEELNITMKQVNHFSNTTSTFENISPMEMTIEETLKLRADERRKKLKEFNYKFHNNVSRIDEMEKEPAYKRLGIDLEVRKTTIPIQEFLWELTVMTICSCVPTIRSCTIMWTNITRPNKTNPKIEFNFRVFCFCKAERRSNIL